MGGDEKSGYMREEAGSGCSVRVERLVRRVRYGFRSSSIGRFHLNRELGTSFQNHILEFRLVCLDSCRIDGMRYIERSTSECEGLRETIGGCGIRFSW